MCKRSADTEGNSSIMVPHYPVGQMQGHLKNHNPEVQAGKYVKQFENSKFQMCSSQANGQGRVSIKTSNSHSALPISRDCKRLI